MYKFTLEKGSKKHTCPNCSQKRFVRYVKRSNNQYLNADVGRCDRESKCGYHYTPKTYFADNPKARQNEQDRKVSKQTFHSKNPIQAKYEAQISIKRVDYIDKKYLWHSLCNYEQNAFVQFLINLFPQKVELVQKATNDYFIGTTPDGKTIFWQIDNKKRIRTGKIIAYDKHTGKRSKSIHPNWVHAELKKYKKVRNDFNLKQCFFGEHLIKKDSYKTLCIVEAEKTAVIASIHFPEFTWLAVGAKQNLKYERIKQLGRNRKIILSPDADSFEEWNKTAQKAQKSGFDVSISKLIQTNANDTERSNGFDLADYLISERTLINKQQSV